MSGFQGHTRAYDLDLNGYGLTVYRPKGVPAWTVRRVADVSGEAPSTQDKPKSYRSTHSGCGWGQMLVENVCHYGVNVDTRWPMGVCLGPLVYSLALSGTGRTAVTGFFEIGGALFALAGKWLNKIVPNATPGSDAVTVTAGPPAFPYDLTTGNANASATVGVRFDAAAIIGTTTADMMSFDGTNAPTVLSNPPPASYLTRYYGDDDQQIAAAFLSSSNPSVMWAAQGADLTVNANWTGNAGIYGVGDRSASVTGLVGVDRLVYVAMTDGLYAIDGRSTRAPAIFNVSPVHANNGINTYADTEGLIWYPSKAGLKLFDPAALTIDDVTPLRGLPNTSGIAGDVTALVQVGAWMFAAMAFTDSSGVITTNIMVGRRREPGEPGFGPYIWHGALAQITGTTTTAKVTAMHVSSLVTPPRLWLGMASGDVKSFILPANGDNPMATGSLCTFAASGTLFYGADDFGAGGMRWVLSDVVTEGETITSNQVLIKAAYDLAAATTLATVTASGRTSTALTTGDHRFTRAALQAVFTNNASSSTPILRSLTGQATPRPTMRDIIETTVILDDQELSRLGIQTRSTAAEIITQLKTYDTGALYTLKDYWTGSEVSHTVIMLPADLRMVKQEGDDPAVYIAGLTFKVIA